MQYTIYNKMMNKISNNPNNYVAQIQLQLLITIAKLLIPFTEKLGYPKSRSSLLRQNYGCCDSAGFQSGYSLIWHDMI